MTDSDGRWCAQCGYSATYTPVPIPEDLPRIRSLLASNDRPTEQEENTFRKFLNDGQSQIERLERRTTKVSLLLEQLKLSLHQTKLRVAQVKPTLNPVRRLPPEVLERIFSHSAGITMDPVTYFVSAPHSLDLKAPPWVLGRVCRFWNAVIMGAPLLWTRTKVSVTEINRARVFSTSGGNALALSFLSLYLARSSSRPLSIYVDLSKEDFQLSSEFMPAIGALLFSHSRRWESLFLHDYSASLFETIRLSPDSLPLLKNVQVQAAAGLAGATNELRVAFIASGLTSWTTLGTTRTLTPSLRLYSQITAYSFIDTPFSDILAVVRQLPCLQTLKVERPRGGLEVVHPLLLLPNIRVLALTGAASPESDLQAWHTFIDSIACPAISSLELDRSPPDFGKTLQRFESRSNFRLQNLNVCSLLAKDVFKLGSSETIQTLGITVTGWWDVFSLRHALLCLKSKRSSVVFAFGDPVSPSTVFTFGNPSDQNTDGATDIGSPSHSVPPTYRAELLPMPQLRRLELYLEPASTMNSGDIMADLTPVIVSRTTGQDSHISPRELFIRAPDILARNLTAHASRNDIMQRGVKVDILGF
ncbi:hypothetical protein D9757_005102 [Collybiopsis confluens]|uniref:F-box domain-containing protein n=1 Tax=Collybiopsis confluens TaxID=2823264 RepID=A0A8H5HT50_9AGAR|nr:hypothetical protein D9757_005102 [Collybiopsis confluens]